MRFQTTLEGAECLRRSDAGWQSVPDTRRSDEERAVTNDMIWYDTKMVWQRADVDEDRSRCFVSHIPV